MSLRGYLSVILTIVFSASAYAGFFEDQYDFEQVDALPDFQSKVTRLDAATLNKMLGVIKKLQEQKSHLGGKFQSGGGNGTDAVFDGGNVGIGTLSPNTDGEQPLKLDVEGSIGAAYFCDSRGNSCVTSSQVQKILPVSDGNAVKIFSYENVDARDAAIENPLTGQVVFLQDEGILSYYNGTDWIKVLGRLAGSAVDTTGEAVADLGTAIMHSLDSGSTHSCVVMTDGRIKCWGQGADGRLGNNSTADNLVPVTANNIDNAVKVTVGANHSCALLSDGTLKCWGDNSSGCLGNGNATDQYNPVPVVHDGGAALSNVIDVSAGMSHTCAVIDDGSVYCWGVNWAGQLGDGTTTTQYYPTAVIGINNATQVAVGGDHSCALLSDGQIKCWGYNSKGELGTGDNNSTSTPEYVFNISNAAAITAGYWHTCAVTTTGRAKCWGLNDNGELGDGTTGNRNIPVDVGNISNAIGISAWGNYAAGHTCVVTDIGEVKCWGDNANGALGNGTTNDSGGAVMVGSIANAIGISAGHLFSCALLTDASVSCWGYNSHGELGNSSTTDSTTPVAVSGLSGVVTTAYSGGDSSDIRLKENIIPVKDMTSAITALEPVEYHWKDRSKRGNAKEMGFIAQEVEQLFPEAVSQDLSGYKYIHYDRLIVPLIDVVKRQQTEIKRQRQELADLKNQVFTLSDLVKSIQQKILDFLG
jgi:alpha-tubulin suppressor-like RCC1 family protein